jgi:sodium borate transporter 11
MVSRLRNVRHVHIFTLQEERFCQFGRGIQNDVLRRLPHYVSDYRDGFMDTRTVHKIISTTMFLYFACILPAIAFGVLNDHNTEGKIGKS